MELELWTNSEDEFGYIINDDIIKRRVYLENHTLIEGIDVSEIDTLNALYNKELFKKDNNLDTMDFLVNISKNWFNIICFFNGYKEFDDCIVFNHNDNKFESLVDTYSNIVEKYIDSYNEEGSPIILGEFEFQIRKRLNIDESFNVKIEPFYEEYLYRIKGSNSYLYEKHDLSLGVKKGIVIGKYEANSLLNYNKEI